MSQYHVADIALVSDKGGTAGGYMIVPLIHNHDTKTQIYPVYSEKKIVDAKTSLPNILNEVIKLTQSFGVSNRLKGSAVLNKLSVKQNRPSILRGHRSRALSNLSGSLNCTSFTRLRSNSSDRLSTLKSKITSRSRSSKVNCSSCLTPIDPEFKYCPCCGVLRRNLSGGDFNSYKSSRPHTPNENGSAEPNIQPVFTKPNSTMQQGKKWLTWRDDQTFDDQFSLDTDSEEEGRKERPNEPLPRSSSDIFSKPIQSSGSYDIDALGEKISSEQPGPMFQCPTCSRTFIAKSLAIHRRSCGHTVNFERRPLLRRDEKSALTITKSRKYCRKERWRP